MNFKLKKIEVCTINYIRNIELKELWGWVEGLRCTINDNCNRFKKLNVPRNVLPPGAKEGDVLQNSNGDLATVEHVTGTMAVLDYNHPLAGKPLMVRLKVLKVENPWKYGVSTYYNSDLFLSASKGFTMNATVAKGKMISLEYTPKRRINYFRGCWIWLAETTRSDSKEAKRNRSLGVVFW